MRGKHHLAALHHKKFRITPAHAGKTKTSSTFENLKTDHPRTCGENSPICADVPQIDGSPPHMRGKHFIKSSSIPENRITPAHAGKTGKAAGKNFTSSDHPRTCGENGTVKWFNDQKGGSPPHMRGKRSIATEKFATTRITPAHAGKTRQDIR